MFQNKMTPKAHSLISILTITAFTVLSLASRSFGEGEVWIDDGGTGGTGTISDPYKVNSAITFDARMVSLCNSNSSNLTIHLLPGTYETSGSSYNENWFLKAGYRLKGSGAYSTRLKLATGAPNNRAVVASGFTASKTEDGIEVSDLTIDCNYASGMNYYGVLLYGNDCSIRRVHCVNIGSSTGWGYGLRIVNSNYRAAATNAVIENCKVSSFHGLYVAGIAIGGINNARIKNNTIEDSIATTRRTAGIYEVGGSKNVIISDNFFSGTYLGFYHQGNYLTNCIVSQNGFRGCIFPVYLMLYSTSTIINGLSILNNKIELGGNSSISADANAISMYSTFPNKIQTVSITGNSITWVDRLSIPNVNGGGILLGGPGGIIGGIVTQNTIETNLFNIVTSECSGVNRANNYNFEGFPVNF